MNLKELVAFVLVVGLVFIFSSTALGNGSGGGLDISIYEPDDRLEIIGTFEARKFKVGAEYKCVVSADLNWTNNNGVTSSKRIELDLPDPISPKSVCDYNKNQLGKIFALKIDAETVLPLLSLDKTNKILVLRKLIITGGNCDGLPLHQQKMFGEITIKVQVK